jgi:hypothetical protein
MILISEVQMLTMTREPAIAFANQLRSARLAALADAEAFDGIIHAVERLGSYLSKERLGAKGEFANLNKYKSELKDLAAISATAMDADGRFKTQRRFEARGLAGLTEGEHPGRPPRLNTAQMREINRILRGWPSDAGMPGNLWDGNTLIVRNPVCAEFGNRLALFANRCLRIRTPTCHCMATMELGIWFRTPQSPRSWVPRGMGRTAESACRRLFGRLRDR